jgi:uncharacterized protein involved in response to NO
MSVMAGRVLPMFTNNGVPGAGARSIFSLELLANGSVASMLVADALPGPHVAIVTLSVALIHFIRWGYWKPWKTLRAPLVWVLHVAYLWIPIYLLLRGFADLGWVPANLATHALTAGAIGGLTIGMMTRTARGHTGRLLTAGVWETLAYIAIFMAAAVRVFVPLLAPGTYMQALQVSAVLWALGFAIYFVHYWPFLTRARVDGRAG